MAGSVLRSGWGTWATVLGQTHRDRPSRSFAQVPAVFACVSVKADAVGGLPLMISTLDDRVIESGPLAELAQRPNREMTGRVFLQTTSAMMDLFGRVHWVFTLDSIGLPVEVIPVSPLQMTPNIDRATGKVVSWDYRAAGVATGQKITILADEVHTIIDPDYDDTSAPWRGLGPRAVLTAQIAQLYKADLANEAVLDNGVAPSGAFVTEGNLTDEQRDYLHRVVRDGHAGSRNRGRHLLLSGGLDWKAIGASFSDMEFLDLKKHNWVEVCAVFRVPPPVVGIYDDSNYAHADAANQTFYESAVLPRAERIAEEWTVGVLSRFESDRSIAAADARQRVLQPSEKGCGVYRKTRKAAGYRRGRFFAWLDSSGVGPIQRARLALADQVVKWNSIGVPLNAITRAFDMPWEEFAWGDTWHKPIGLVDVNEDLPTDPPGSDDELPALPEPGEGEDPTRSRQLPAELRTSEQTKAALWAQWRSSWKGLEKAVRGKVSRHFDELRRETLAKLNEVSIKDGSMTVQRDVVGEILFDMVKANEGLIVKVGKFIRDAYRLGGEQSMQEAADAQGLDKPAAFNIDDPRLERIQRTRLIRITDTNRTLRRRLASSLADGVAAGETTAKLADRIRSEFKFAANRAATIARTEVGAAVEESRSEGRRQAGVPLKSWLWSRKETGRPSHAATEKATLANPIPNDEQFTIAGTGHRCDHPRAASLPPGQSVNCACTTIARFEGDTIKTVIARYQRRGFLTYEQLIQRDRQRVEGN
jgi:HK97 family phage portal protein